jgi:hypothetical protein
MDARLSLFRLRTRILLPTHRARRALVRIPLHPPRRSKRCVSPRVDILAVPFGIRGGVLAVGRGYLCRAVCRCIEFREEEVEVVDEVYAFLPR